MALYDITGKLIVTGGSGDSSSSEQIAEIENFIYDYTKWKDKILVLHGNSLTKWGGYLADYLRMQPRINTNSGGSLTGTKSMEEIIAYVEEKYPEAVNLVLIQGDGNTTTSGEFADQLDGENPVNTWTARVNYLIRCIRARYPNVVIALLVDSVWYVGLTDQYTEKSEKNRYMYSQIKGLAEYNRCAFLDVDHNTPFNPTHGLDNYYSQYVLGSDTTIDGVHPNTNYLTAKARAVMHHVAGLVYNPDAPNTTIEGWQDRITYTITNELTNVTNNMTATNWAANNEYTAKLTATTGTISSVTITMGGIDVTADVYTESTRKISITRVTGNIVITATATTEEA